ncbi:MAG: hypothetical protein A2921_00695 [Candidatus Magasanikbacteria bacterium RIFCSPLOWO2_01_FULL_43_20b]|nr:MAG: hypothetical protein A2921_00695 [Candidatus Magasanikbacteria bacterium RIFCSPLOWO2_01_FULL_43_20b]
MGVKITYFVHGTTTDNEREISSGWGDAELSELGVRQAIELVNYLKPTCLDAVRGASEACDQAVRGSTAREQTSEATKKCAKHGGFNFDVVFCSDLKRAAHSAELAFEGVAMIIEDARLRECNYGTFNGKSSLIVEPMCETKISKQFPEGESYEDVKRRMADFLEFLNKNYDGKHVAIVSHKAPQLALDVLLKNKEWKQAFACDWRKTKRPARHANVVVAGGWKPGWEYTL